MSRVNGKKVNGAGKVEFEFRHYLDWEEVKKMCEEHNFYDLGDLKSYREMLDKCKKVETPNDCITIAQDILDHTDEKNEWLYPYEPFDEMVCYISNLLKVEIYERRVFNIEH